MNPAELRLEIERLKTQARALRLRAAELEMDVDRVAQSQARIEQDNLPTTPFNAKPPEPEIEVEFEP